MLVMSPQSRTYSQTAQPEKTGLADVANLGAACEYGSYYYWWYSYIPTSRCHAPAKER